MARKRLQAAPAGKGGDVSQAHSRNQIALKGKGGDGETKDRVEPIAARLDAETAVEHNREGVASVDGLDKAAAALLAIVGRNAADVRVMVGAVKRGRRLRTRMNNEY